MKSVSRMLQKNSAVTLLLSLAVLLCACEQKSPEQLSKQYCGSCHSYPEPAQLDKHTWEKGVLPQMAFRMGVDYSLLKDVSEHDMPEVLRALPDKAMVTQEEWIAIRDFYLQHAPDSLARPAQEALPELKQFTATPVQLPGNLPLVTLVQYDPSTRQIFAGTRLSKLYRLNAALVMEDSFQLQSPPSHLLFGKNGELIIACMGIMDPNDQAAGKIISITPAPRGQNVLIDSIKRPVHLQQADLNNDGLDDLVVAAFGNYTGALLVDERSAGGYHKHHTVHTLPGTRKTIVDDFNGDGLNDILALITQGDEQITLFINEGNFKFSPQVLLRFSPVYGSSYFDRCDFNGDGHFDILYTNGDNADYSSIFKPYHGVRLFLNNGSNHFRESWFHPMPGASQAVARDFDQDGDLDVAAIAFFPDLKNHPEQGFLYFENNSGKLSPQVTPMASMGRWLTLEAADYDRDGDEDLLLGALDFTAAVPDSLLEYWQKQKTAILVLQNKQRSFPASR